MTDPRELARQGAPSELSPEELEREMASELPDREALSLVSLAPGSSFIITPGNTLPVEPDPDV